MRRRRNPNREPHLCLVQGCETMIPGWKRLCDSCFRRLPFAQRKAIAEAGQARATHIVSQLAIEAATWLEEHSPAAETARRLGERDYDG